MTRRIATAAMGFSSFSNVSLWIGGFTLLCVLWFLLLGGHLNLLCAIMIGGGLLLLGFYSRAGAALMTLTYLNVMGDIRRLTDVLTGFPSFDFLLLIAPVVAFLLAIPSLFDLRLRDNLSKTMFFFTVIMVIEIANPQQGGLAVGFSGAMFYVAPVLWFWIGRNIATVETVERLLYRVIFPLALSASLLGLYQTFIGFFPFEQAWIDKTVASYTALSLGTTIRAFGFSVSAAEYATLLELAAVGIVAAWLSRKSSWILTLPLLLTATFLASGRTIIVKLFLAIVVVWTLRKGKQLTTVTIMRLILLFAFGMAGIGFIASRYAPSDSTSFGKQSAAENALSHVSGGLAHPFNSRYSTVGVHQGMFFRGILAGLTNPIGYGLGATTGAAAKFSGTEDTYDPNAIYSSEIDLSDMFIDLGAIGGFFYIAIFIMAIRSAIAYTRNVPRHVSLPVLGILFSTIGAWLISGQYSTSALIFFLVGALAHGADRNRSPEKKRVAIRRLRPAPARSRPLPYPGIAR